ncbi:dimethyl sulfoxide reductase anchor subunit family protein [Parendozoicomonas haliclonae]|uniref:Anaerobic dimethyl sulfoxide reductase chain C n=1 Tax=Parendozoicomonas haliclonae TaxID=1960125 RepID=A0A1X7AQZ1_9GAMM|nr:DmsC/YnfH family molybdoenzyme membrane anchor subunit [Parendozoicomonas haliclonae]SMA50741.1 Anaerobic dimethyl sulfoxide reductase chain C [Parendozoicomonas haliclonae]
MHQYQFSLVFFTVLTQWALGSILMISLYRAATGGQELNNSKLTAIALWLICGFGSLCSLAHLGNPLQGYYALRGLGSSWMSREVIVFGGINGLTTLWLLTHLVKGKENLQQTLGLITGVCGLAAITMTGQIYYAVEHQPSWHTPLTHIGFVSTALLLGLATLALVLRQSSKEMPAGFRALLTASVVMVFAVTWQLAQITGLELNGVLVWYRVFASLMVGCGLLVMAKSLNLHSTAMVGLAVLLMVSGEIAGRMGFYGSVLGKMPW